jgi:hypothetical protein
MQRPRPSPDSLFFSLLGRAGYGTLNAGQRELPVDVDAGRDMR